MSEISDTHGMEKAWRDRLAAAIKQSGKSMRAVSLGAGYGPGYVHSILKDNKDPTIDHLIDVCGQLGISLSYLIYGVDVSGENERILHLLQDAPPLRRKGILQILEDEANPPPQ